MKSLAFFFASFIALSPSFADMYGVEMQPSAELTFLDDNVTLGQSDGTWCGVTIDSENNKLSGLGSPMFQQVNSSGVMTEAPLIGAIQVSKAFKFILKGDDLTVEVREVPSGKLMCSFGGNHKKASRDGSWAWPTPKMFDGFDVCDTNQKPAKDQKVDKATLTVECSK